MGNHLFETPTSITTVRATGENGERIRTALVLLIVDVNEITVDTTQIIGIVALEATVEVGKGDVIETAATEDDPVNTLETDRGTVTVAAEATGKGEDLGTVEAGVLAAMEVGATLAHDPLGESDEVLSRMGLTGLEFGAQAIVPLRPI